MPGRVQNGRKRPSIAVSDDDEENSDYPSSVSVGSKRARHRRDASESPIRFQGHGNRHSRANGDASETYVEGAFPPGALVRVKLKNFVTYTAAEFHLGPSLNMIIGPNGTGKSTLVCAICLGLGWSSEHLGRAKETGLFVKNGSTEAEIEIELAAERAKDGEPQQPNPIVRRIIRRDDNKTVFFIDGKPVGKRAVLALCERFSIQIDNLCQFLPQDRVVEFARMGPVDRLRETQRAAAPPYMIEWHEQLKALRVEQRGHARQHQEKKNDLESLEKAQARDRPDVERIHQREGLMQRAKCLRKVKPIIELNLRKEAVTQAKKDAVLARRELDQLTADVAPLQEAQAEAETYMNQIVQVVAHRKNRVNMMKTQAEKFFTRIEKEKQAVTGFTGEISGEASSKKVRERDMARMKADIAKLERQKQEKPVDFDAGAYSSRLNELRSQRSAASARHTEKKDVYQQLKLQGHNLNQENRSLNEQRQQLDTQGGKQAGVLVQISRDTAKAWEWFQKNRGSLNLKGEVHGPPILECSIPDPRYASAVESQLRKGELVGITCTNGDDQKFLSDRFLSKPDEGGLGLHDVHLRTSSKPRSNYQPPVASADLPSLGFQSYIIDHIQGPDAVLAMLCDNKSLHKIAYTSGPITDEQTATVSSSRIQKWVSGTTISQITTRKEYGASSTAVTQLSPARCFVDQPVNTEKMRQLEDALKRVQREGQELRENVETIKQELKDVEQEIDKVKVEIESVETEREQVRKAVAAWAALPAKISQKQDEHDRLGRENAETSNRIRAIKTKLQQAVLDSATMTLEYAKATTQFRAQQEAMVEAELRLIEAKSELNTLNAENHTILQKLENKKNEIGALEQQIVTLRQEYSRTMNAVQADLATLTPDERALVIELRELKTLEALELQVQDVEARLEMMADGNPGAIKAFEKREVDITKTKEKLENLEATLESTKEKIVEIRQKWEPELDVLIRKISDAFAHNFQEIGCAGEVIVHKEDDDFDKWSAQISVRFREGETLSVLDSHRQSGGERAVSTIFYLMALQDLAQSPFRVVDEINQGMDPRNERMVHERMVDIACQERTSQYFLVTPKLLEGLKFHPKMKVHVINSGEHVPAANQATGNWNMTDWAKIAMRTRKGVTVA